MQETNLESHHLGILAMAYQSDKLQHGYIEQYIQFLPERNKCKKLLEIGAWQGASLKIWRNYFPVAQIYTVENFYYPDSASQEELESQGFKVFRGNQEDISFLQKINEQFDVIIDDGSHLPDHQQITFKQLFHKNLAPGGLYIIEDLHTNLDKHFWHNIDETNDTALTALQMIKSNVKGENKYFSSNEFKKMCDSVQYVRIFENETEQDYKSMIGFIKKKEA